MPAALAPSAMARATSRPLETPPVAMMVSKPSGASMPTLAAVGMPQSQSASPSARAAWSLRGLGALGLDGDPRRAAGARDVDVADAGADEALADATARGRSRSP